MRYDTQLEKMLTGLGLLKMSQGSAAQTRQSSPWDYGAKQKEARLEKYRKHRRIRNKMARESRRRNRAS